MRPASLLAVGAAVLLLGACCPIPIQRDVTVRPQLDVRVTDASGAPVGSVPIVARRLIVGPPPLTETDRWTGNTSPQGRVVLEAIQATEPSMPLMMHGVNWYGWEACAEHGGKAGLASWNADKPVVDAPVRLDVQLTRDGTCAALLDHP